MHVGIATGFQHQSGDEVDDRKFLQEDLEMALLAESLGFESIWVTEHHFSNYSLSPAPLQTVTAASAQYSSPARRIIVASTSAADSVSATLVYSNPPRFRCVTLNGIFGYRR